MSTSDKDGEKWIDMVEGVKRRTLVSGKTMMQMRVHLDIGSHLPEHQHPNEQVTFIQSGHLRLTVAGEARELHIGDSFYIASNVPHSADAMEDTVAIDTFSPPREDLLAQDRQHLK